MSEIERLRSFPNIGSLEPLFEDSKYIFRYLVVKKYWKVIYFILGDTCHISVIWDVRNNPEILKNIAEKS